MSRFPIQNSQDVRAVELKIDFMRSLRFLKQGKPLKDGIQKGFAMMQRLPAGSHSPAIYTFSHYSGSDHLGGGFRIPFPNRQGGGHLARVRHLPDERPCVGLVLCVFGRGD